MWEYEHSVETAVAAEAIWHVWSDMDAWPEWNDGLAKIEVEGPFAVGTAFAMTAPGDDEPIRMRLVEIVPGEVFTDQMDAGDFLVTTVHRLEPLPGGGTRVVYRTEISGPAAGQVGPELGPQITGDFPDVLAALVRRAEG
ncbi:MAG: polyketide cyclase [Nonomuraea sp.]|nr:polyketide cyclase [Nonomuraea sp.]